MNGGAAWLPVTIDVTRRLAAGSAPYQDVCWLVGSAGAVYRTTNGTDFTVVRFPEPVDLIAVEATDADRVRVTAVDGRIFTTTDGGLTWSR